MKFHEHRTTHRMAPLRRRSAAPPVEVRSVEGVQT